MKKEDEKLKSIFLSENLNSSTPSRKDCPSPEELISSFDPGAPFEFKKKIIDHVAQCPACQREFELIKASHQLVREVENKLLTRRTGLLSRLKLILSDPLLIWKLVTVSIVFLIVISGLYFGINYRKNLETRRGPNYSELPGLSEEIKLSKQSSIVLSWQPAAGATFYRVEIFDENMAFLWQSHTLTETSLLLPETLTDILKNKQFFFWQLVIYSNDKRLIECPVRKVKLLVQ
jgi:hypothetical protein